MTQVQTAWLQALFSILVLWGLGNLAVGVSSQVFGNNGLIYTCTLFISSAWVLLAYAGHGALSKETIRSIDTWAYGLVLIISFLASFALFSMVTASEGALLQRSSILASMLTSWFFLSRNPSKQQLVGALIVSAGLLIICAGLPTEDKAIVYILVIIFAFLQTARVLIAEYHRPHQEAVKQENNVKTRARVVGYVMFVVGMLFLVSSFLLSLLQYSTGEIISTTIPSMSDYIHAPSILWGIVIGVLVIAPIRLIEFSSSHIIKSENYLALACLAPFSTLFWEWSTAPWTGLSLKAFTTTDLFAATVMTIGGLVMALAVLRKEGSAKIDNYLQTAPQELEIISDSREIIANAIEHFDGNINAACTALELPKEVITAVLNDDKKILAFTPKALNKASRNYRNKVAMCDALTGLTNRAGFMKSLKNAPQEIDTFSVLYIDLDKFKPVNDTYGHDVGDAVLQGVATRLKEFFPKNAVVSRLGGDEFCVLMFGASKIEAQQRAIDIEEGMRQPFILLRDRIAIGASVGVATFPEDGHDTEKLIKLADGSMYEQKTGSER